MNKYSFRLNEGLIAVKSLKKLVSRCNYIVYDVFYEHREITHRNDYIILHDLGKSGSDV